MYIFKDLQQLKRLYRVLVSHPVQERNCNDIGVNAYLYYNVFAEYLLKLS